MPKCSYQPKSYQLTYLVVKTTRYMPDYMKISYILAEHCVIRLKRKFEIRGFFSVPINSVSRGQHVYIKISCHGVCYQFPPIQLDHFLRSCWKILMCTSNTLTPCSRSVFC